MARSSDLLAQVVAGTVICTVATVAAVFPVGNPAISGEGLIGIYAGALGYIFGIVPGKIAQRNGQRG